MGSTAVSRTKMDVPVAVWPVTTQRIFMTPPRAAYIKIDRMFTPERRTQLRDQLLRDAAGDRRIGGAALTGSVAEGREDRWSDVDLAFGVAEGADLEEVLADCTKRMYERHQAVHHVDVRAGAWVYRVFLRRDTLQVDLAFVPAADFRALGPSFRMISGTAREARHALQPD